MTYQIKLYIKNQKNFLELVEHKFSSLLLLFIPNESIYSFLNQENSSLIDYSLKNKILLCLPINLYVILSLIR